MAARTESLKNKPGIYRYHSRDCARVERGAKCSCQPAYQATAYSKRDRKRIVKHFDRLAEAQSWRDDIRGAIKAGKAVGPSKVTVAQALDDLLAGIESDAILNRSSKPYKPSAKRSYKRAAERLKTEIGYMRLDELRRRDLNELIQRQRAAGMGASTIRNTLDPLRVVYRLALDDEIVAIDPTRSLRLPSMDGVRDRTAAPAESEALISALPESEQALWATALYIGLRRGELQELRWRDLDLEQGIGRCERAWDDEGRAVVETKSKAGERLFPLVAPVRKRLVAHKLRTGRGGDDLVFGGTSETPFVPSTIRRRALKAWEAAGLQPITLHEGRHSAATSGSAAGLDDLALSHIMGHSSVVITRDRYGHVRPDRIAEVREQMDAYYEGAAG